MQKIAIITTGYFPIPAVLGGAVENLVENLIRQNETGGALEFSVFSCYHPLAAEKSSSYHKTQFEFVKIPGLIQLCDKIIYFFAKRVLNKDKNFSYRYILQRLYYIRQVARKLRDNDYNKILIENQVTLLMALKLYGNMKKYQGRYYFHLHNVVSNDFGCGEILANCRKVIGVSDYVNGTLRAHLAGRDHNSYAVLRNRISREHFAIQLDPQERESLRGSYGVARADVLILFAGRFCPEKGVMELLEAFSRLNIPNAKLLIAGSYYFGSDAKSSFEENAKAFVDSMKDQVRFTGYVDYEKMPQLYAIADIVALPSVCDDSAPLTIIEALTSGKALITTASGGIPEYADPESSIILTRGDDLVDQLEAALRHLVTSADTRLTMAQAVHEKTKNWTTEVFYRDFCELIG